MSSEDKNIYSDIWNSICYTMDRNKYENEAILQILLENSILPRLNWEISKGEIIRPTIQLGSAKFIKPDAVLCKNGDNCLVIELKKALVKASETNEQQLFSYMRELKLQFGILWGQSICIYYDDILDKKTPQKVCEIFFNKDNENGIELVEVLYKENFNEINFENYCLAHINKFAKQKENEQKINFLCSQNGVEYIKQLLSTEYAPEIINSIDIRIINKNKPELIGCKPPLSNKINVHCYKSVTINNDSLSKGQTETVQNWLKRVLTYLFQNNILTENEIEHLHDKSYTKQTLGMPYQLLFDYREHSFIGGAYRTWKEQIGDYYICSQLTNTPHYETRIALWLNKVLSNKN